jgi:Zn-dependent protease
MLRSWKLGTAFGIGIYVHWSFLLLPAYILISNWAEISNWSKGGLPLAAFLLALIAAMAGCIILHELGHALMARYFGIGTRDITLYPIGGVARLERMSERPGEELLIALAGPAVNLAIAGALLFFGVILLGLGVATGFDINPEGLPTSAGGTFLVILIVSNLLLGGFNLIPAFPMDGGRVLRALLSWPMGRLQATEVAAAVGMVVAVVGGLAGFWLLKNPMLLLLGAFVFFMARQELAAVRRREAMRQAEEELEVLPADEEPVEAGPALPARRGFSGIAWDRNSRVWVIWRDGRPVGFFGAPPE